MPLVNHQNFFSTTLTSGVIAGATTTPLNSIPTVDCPFYLTFDATGLNGNQEVVLCTSKTATNVNHAALSHAHTTSEEVRMAIVAEEANTLYNQANGGWNGFTTVNPAWVSTDGSTNVINFSEDLTTILSPGMRFKSQQDQALTAYWNFNADSTSQVGSFNGTDTAVTYTAGKFSNAATFNGTTSKIVIADNASLKPTGEFTIGCWFKTGTTGTTKVLFQSKSANTSVAGIYLFVGSANNLRFQTGKNTGTVSGTDFITLDGTTTVTDNALHYAVVSFRNNYAQVYLDGKLEISGYIFTPAYAATNYVRIGCGNDTGTDNNFMNGQIDDLFLINGYALDEKTIKKQYDLQTAQGTGNITVNKYALITAVAPYAAGVTPITIWGGTDYSLANSTISSPYYATVSQPFGFDRNPAKWTVEVSSNVNGLQASPVSGTWYNLGGSIVIPIGKWRVLTMYNAYAQGNTPLGTIRFRGTLSTANNSESDIRFSAECGASVTVNLVNSDAYSHLTREVPIDMLAKTTYYLNFKNSASTSTVANGGFVGGNTPTIIRATSTLL